MKGPSHGCRHIISILPYYHDDLSMLSFFIVGKNSVKFCFESEAWHEIFSGRDDGIDYDDGDDDDCEYDTDDKFCTYNDDDDDHGDLSVMIDLMSHCYSMYSLHRHDFT